MLAGDPHPEHHRWRAAPPHAVVALRPCSALVVCEIEGTVGRGEAKRKVDWTCGCSRVCKYLCCLCCRSPPPGAQPIAERADAGTQLDPRMLFVRHERLATYEEDEVAKELGTTTTFAAAGTLEAKQLWGFSAEAETQTFKHMLGNAETAEAETATELGTGSVEQQTQLTPLPVDPSLPDIRLGAGVGDSIGQLDVESITRVKAAGGAYAYYVHYVSYPAIGSIFSGPWVCEARNFYNGSCLQLEYESEISGTGRSDRSWEPLHAELPTPWHSPSVYKLVPLCALWSRVSPEGRPSSGRR